MTVTNPYADLFVLFHSRDQAVPIHRLEALTDQTFHRTATLDDRHDRIRTLG